MRKRISELYTGIYIKKKKITKYKQIKIHLLVKYNIIFLNLRDTLSVSQNERKDKQSNDNNTYFLFKNNLDNKTSWQ